MTVAGIEEAKKKRDRLLHYGGTQLQEVAYSLPDPVVDTAPEGNDVFQVLVQKLSDYFSPAQNLTFERHVFRKIKPESEENFEKFLLRVRHAAKRCSFGKNETESSELNMKDLIIDNWASLNLKKAILEKEHTLDQVIELCLIYEQITNQSASMRASTSQVLTNSSYVNKINYQGNKKAKNCSRCGRMRHGNNQVCPAKDVKCHTCGLKGHYA
uniref:Uncharacterized protein n=1 Tax=Trichogramma kaykai TaxID=54128 RepID=A0ABD2WZD1_9HYME